MENIIWLVILFPVSCLFTGFGIYAFFRRKPMWFWSGSKVSENEISDVSGYNRANGIMWIVFSCIFWISLILGIMNMQGAGIFLIAGCVIGIPALPIVYSKIYKKYKR